jgi:hypothetical protein
LTGDTKNILFKLQAMEKGMKLKVRKELDGKQQSNIIKLKGSLIAKGYTQIIHILFQDQEFHINSFDIEPGSDSEVREFITAFIAREELEDSISIFKKWSQVQLFRKIKFLLEEVLWANFVGL